VTRNSVRNPDKHPASGRGLFRVPPFQVTGHLSLVTRTLALLLTLGAQALAQSDELSIRASRRDSITAGASVTAVFSVTSLRADSIQVLPHIDMPKDWTVLLGGTEFNLLGRETSMLVVSFAVPARAKAGTYPVRVWLTTRNDTKGKMDSVMVTVPLRTGLEIVATDRPGYSVAGNTYEAGFTVRNRGNAPARLRLEVKSTISKVAGVDSVFELGPEEARGLRYNVQTPSGINAATDDVLEVIGRVEGDTIQASASTRIAVVPEPSRKIEEFLRIPTQLNLRAASATGVSPFELYGRGKIIDGRAPVLDFLFRGPTGAHATFGERDEYRAELSTKSWRVRGGDHVFILSPLSSSSQPGFGVGADADVGRFSLGAYGQEFRRQPEKGSESGAFASYAPFAGARIGVNALNRVGGGLPGTIGSATASVSGDGYNAEGELAQSRNGSSNGAARSVRLSGSSRFGSFDASHLFADTAFTGSQRGAEHNYVTARTSYWQNLSLGVNASAHRADLSRSTGVAYLERFKIGGVSATLFNRFSLEVTGAERSTTTALANSLGRQQSLRFRGDHPLAIGTISLEGEWGQANESNWPGKRGFADASLGLRRSLRNGSVSGYVGAYSGGAITKGSNSNVTIGGDVTKRIGSATDLSVMGYALRQQTAVDAWHTQLDAQVSHTLRSGEWVRFRARLMTGGTLPASQRNVGYLEYGRPFGLPISRLRTVGRVYGRVVDAVSGNGVPNALVRLGPQVAITDRSGNVAFGGVPGGEHRLSMSQETSFTDAVFVGDPTLNVDSTRTQPTNFTLAIARSARVDVAVRRFRTVTTGVAGAADSLVDNGAVANATLVLIGERDTLYRTTNDDGRVQFTDVPPGQWKVLIRGDAPAFHRFDPDRLELTLAPGEAKSISFKLIPRKREVQVIGDGQELKATTADPKNQVGAPGVKVIKPNEQRPQDKQQ
jgi:hypothetical protein